MEIEIVKWKIVWFDQTFVRGLSDHNNESAQLFLFTILEIVAVQTDIIMAWAACALDSLPAAKL